MICVTSTEDVRQVVFGMNGISESGRENQFIIDFSTTDVQETKKMAKSLYKLCKMTWIDAPVSGGPDGAASGTLAIMIFVIVGDLYGGFKESNIFKKLKIILQKERTDELSYGEKLGEYLSRFIIYLFIFSFLLVFFALVYGVYIENFQ